MRPNTKILGFLALISVLVIGMVLMSGCAPKMGSRSTSGSTSRSTASSSSSGDLTAQEAFDKAFSKAKKWSSDAELVSMDNFAGSSETDGKAGRWIVKFNSKKKNKGFVVHVVSGGKILQKSEEDLYTNREPIKGKWMDSPEAVSIALKNGGGKSVRSTWLGLGAYKGKAFWTVKFSHNSGQPSWVKIDAESGKVTRTWEGY